MRRVRGARRDGSGLGVPSATEPDAVDAAVPFRGTSALPSAGVVAEVRRVTERRQGAGFRPVTEVRRATERRVTERCRVIEVGRDGVNPLDLDATELAAHLAAREVSAREVMAAFLERHERLDPQVTALVGVRDGDDLLAEAAAADDALVRGAAPGPLWGFPHAVKDLAEVAGLPFTAGSPVFRDRVGAVDAPFVRRLREAGAILVAKSNVPEFGYGSQTHNPVWGTTRNPHDLALTAGGSSGGAAAALALRMVPVADGSDYMGSLRNPAAFCAVLGFRPSAGRVPQPGFVLQPGEAGPMARTVADLDRLLRVMAGPDPASPTSRHDPLPPLRPPDDLRGLRVGWLGDLGGRLATEPGVLALGRTAADVLAGLGAEVTDALPGFDAARLWRAFLTWRGWSALELAPLYADEDLRAQLKPEVVWEIERGLELSALDVHRAVAERAAWHEALREAFTRHDVLLLPSAQVFPFPVEQHWPAEIDGRAMDTYHRWMEVAVPATFGGVPALGMPAGADAAGRPMGVQLIGPPGEDVRVLEIGALYEGATRWVRRLRPALLDS